MNNTEPTSRQQLVDTIKNKNKILSEKIRNSILEGSFTTNNFREPIHEIITEISTLLKSKLDAAEYDGLLAIINQWDSLFSYYNKELPTFSHPPDKSLTAQNIAKNKKLRFVVGQVVSCSMNKTVVIKTTKIVKHDPTEKRILRTTKYFVHDENNECKVGDVIIAEETRPLSKKKHHKLFRKIIF